ncbi:MAG: AbrB/MazE/SpoVT family DNA-binding domain-containing protein [Actinomycetota bacterium]
MSSSFPVRVGNKGRIVLPAQLRAAISVAEGDELIARAEGRGRLVIETRTAIKERLHRQAAAARAKPGVVERLRSDRRADARLDEAKRAKRDGRSRTSR